MATPSKSIDEISSALHLRRSGKTPPCTMPKRAVVVLEASDLRAHRCVRSIDASTSACDSPYAGHSSKAMAMSTPIFVWIPTETSGERNCSDPSRWLRNSTPSSRTLRIEASDQT